MAIRDVPHVLASRTVGRLDRRGWAPRKPPVLSGFALIRDDDAVLLAVSGPAHLPRRRTICPINWKFRLSAPQPLVSAYQLLLAGNQSFSHLSSIGRRYSMSLSRDIELSG
jgi:hypothetical protein